MNSAKCTLIAIALAGFVLMGCGTNESEQSSTQAADHPEQAVARNISTDGYPTAPDFKLLDLSGNEVELSDFRGKMVILNFWATWCAPCRYEIPLLVDLYKEYNDEGLEIIGISVDDGGTSMVKEFSEKYRINYPVLMYNREVIYSYGGVYSIPTTFIITRGGKVVNRFIGNPGEEAFRLEIERWIDNKS